MFWELSRGEPWERLAMYLRHYSSNDRENERHRARRLAARRAHDPLEASRQREWWRKSAAKKYASLSPEKKAERLARAATYKRALRAARKVTP